MMQQTQKYDWQDFHWNHLYYLLYKKLKTAGNVFLYHCWKVPDGHNIDSSHHREIIVYTLEQFRQKEITRTQSYLQEYDAIISNPKNQKQKRQAHLNKKHLESYLNFSINIHDARCVTLNNTYVEHSVNQQPISNNWFHELHQAFKYPPYSLRGTEQEIEVLWQQLCEFVGLSVQRKKDLIILDWVHNKHNTSWSEFFNDGLEWWGVWCITIYNPRQQSLGCLIASATD